MQTQAVLRNLVRSYAPNFICFFVSPVIYEHTSISTQHLLNDWL